MNIELTTNPDEKDSKIISNRITEFNKSTIPRLESNEAEGRCYVKQNNLFYMKSKSIILLFFILISTISLHAKVTPEILRWSHFRGKVDTQSPYDAKIYCSQNYSLRADRISPNSEKLKLTINANYYIREDKSWVKAGKATERLLNHEKGHYKFSELIILEFLYEANKQDYYISNYKSKVKNIFNRIHQKYVDLEIQYDKETDHMRNVKEQEKWDIWLNKTKQKLIAKSRR